MTTELIKSISIEQLVTQRANIESMCLNALKLLQEAEKIAKTHGMKMPTIRVGEYRHVTGFLGPCKLDDLIAEITKSLDSSAWKHLMDESGMKTFMDKEAREKWSRQINDGSDMQPLTMDNIYSTFKILYEERGEMFENGILNVFKKLSWCYKTNSPFKFGKKIIIDFFLSYGSMRSACQSEIDDLVRVMNVLDGKPEPDHRNGIYVFFSNAIRANENTCENEYLSLKWFKKGSCHVVFKRQDLVDKMNQILVKHYPNAVAWQPA